VNENVVIMGAAGASGQRIARALAARGIPLTLAGRRRATLEPLAAELGASVAETDIARPEPVLSQARMVVNTVGPFAALAPALAAASLAAGVAYVDIANELSATTSLLALDARAKAAGTVLVTGAGFGPAVTEAMLLGLLPTLPGPAVRVRVAGAPSATGGPVSPGIQATAAQAAAEGTAWYAGGALTRAPLGTGGTLLTLGGHAWPMIPAATAELETARRASGAGDVIAYFAVPGQRPVTDGTSYAYAEAQDKDGNAVAALATLPLGLDVTAAITAETVHRLLNGQHGQPGSPAGAWTPGALFGADLVATAAPVTIVPADPATVWPTTATQR
jgi:short subunit dehydrogenase-like uncharacterized protein